MTESVGGRSGDDGESGWRMPYVTGELPAGDVMSGGCGAVWGLFLRVLVNATSKFRTKFRLQTEFPQSGSTPDFLAPVASASCSFL
jgi:hypothetical protein